jgi:glutathionyl-hydroquinone reductase
VVNLAHRTLIVRKLKGLEEILPVTVLHYHLLLTTSWRFMKPDEHLPGPDCTPDPLHPEFKNLSELYLLASPEYPGRFSVPVLWDKKLNTIVNNESSEIIRMLYTEFDAFLPEKYRHVDLYPENLRAEIDLANEWMYDHINNGV